MTTFDRIKNLAKERGLSIRSLAKKADLGETTIYGWKNRIPDSANLQAVADALGVTSDYLNGKEESEKKYYDLNKKDERDIQKKLNEMLTGMTSNDSLAYYSDGEELSDEDKRLLAASLEQTLRLSKELAKKKFTPKKYRHNQD